jgi:hypothetical protein
MVSFRKAFLLMAILVTIAGLASAQQPATCTAYTSNVPTVRSEGIAEEVGQVVIECRGGTSKADGALLDTVNVQIFLNTNVTSRRVSDSSVNPLEALLLIDDPIQANTSAAKTCAASLTSLGCPAYAGGGGSPAGYKEAANGTPGLGVNVIQGRLISNNSIIWTGVPFDPPGTTPLRTLRLVNVRANANGLGLGSTLLPSAIQMFISVSGTAAPNLSNSQLVVAYIQRGLNFGSQDNGASYLQCEPSDGSSARSFRLRFRERFPTAFRNAPGYTAPGTVNQADLRTIYNTEHMYANPSIDGVATSAAGRATQPTRLMATFTGIPTNVLLRFPRTVSSGGDTMEYVQCFDATGTNCSTALLSGTTIDITPTGGTASIVFEMTASSATSQADLTVPVTLRWGPITNGIAGPPGTGTVTVAGSYAPLSATFTSSFTAPAPRFVQDPADTVSFAINPCRTNLLFPYVTHQKAAGGFDTGLVIANTSADKFGTVPQSGACTLEYYGATAGTGAAPGAVTTESIPAGAQLVGTLGLGGNYGLPKAEDFQGYIIARCNFQYAHGFAYIYRYTGTLFDGTMGYLALVLDGDKDAGTTGTITLSDGVNGTLTLSPPRTRTGSISEVRGQ